MTSQRRLLRAASILTRLGVIGVLAVVLLTGLMAYTDAISAAALGGSGSNLSAGAMNGDAANGDATYYRSAVALIEPAMPGLTVSTRPDGTVTLANHTGELVTVFGYGGEPYLRIDSHGVEENVHSLSAVLNSGPLLQSRATDARPQPAHWQHRNDGTTAIWLDSRTHLASGRRPPDVAADPHHAHQVMAWTIRMQVGDQPVNVQGTVHWTGTARFGRDRIVLLATSTLGVFLLASLLLLRRLRLTSDPTPPPSSPSPSWPSSPSSPSSPPDTPDIPNARRDHARLHAVVR